MESVIKVMDLYIKLTYFQNSLKERIQQYIVTEYDHIDFSIDDNIELKDRMKKEYSYLSDDDIELIYTADVFYKKILRYDGMLLHASCVVVDNYAYCFSANSGTGKSTHTKLYLKNIKGSYILNDDKPALRIIDNIIYCYGTPWSGKDDISINERIPLKGICFIKRDANNSISRISNKEAIINIIKQTILPKNEKMADVTLSIIDKIVRNYPIYELKCNMEDEACYVSYNAMKG